MLERFPGIQLYAEKEKQYRGIKPEALKAFGLGGWIMTAVAVEGIRIAVEKVGYQNLTDDAVRDALLGGGIKDFDMGCVPPITMSEHRRYWLATPFLYQIRETTPQFISMRPEVPSFAIDLEEAVMGL